MDLADLIDRNAAFAPQKPAIRFAGRTLSYADFAARIAAAARALRSELGVQRGDRVAILSLNHPDYLVLLYACARLGALLVPLNWRLAVPEQVFILQDASVKALVVEQGFAAVIAPLKTALPDIRIVGLDFAPSFDELLVAGSGDGRNPHVDLLAPLLIVYTSGTTGRPKGAVLRQEALVWNAVMSQHMHDMTADDHVLTVLPLFHVGGLNIQTTPALQLGATVTLYPRFAPDAVLASFTQEKPTLTVLVPATMQAVIEHPAWSSTDINCLRALSTGSTQVPQGLVDAFRARSVPVLEVYGSTETSPRRGVYTRAGGDQRAGSTGLPGLVCEARVVDDDGSDVPTGVVGEVVVRGAERVLRILGQCGCDRRDALREGLVSFRRTSGTHAMPTGTSSSTTAKKNLIISGGENIYPAEVERVLVAHPDIAEGAVIGRPDPRWQEVPVAYVVRRADCGIDAAALEAHLLTQLARFKVPRHYVFVDALPRNAMGKVQHFVLLRETDAGHA